MNISIKMVYQYMTIFFKATVTLGRGLTRCPRIEQNSRNRQSAPERLQPRLNRVRAWMCAHVP